MVGESPVSTIMRVFCALLFSVIVVETFFDLNDKTEKAEPSVDPPARADAQEKPAPMVPAESVAETEPDQVVQKEPTPIVPPGSFDQLAPVEIPPTKAVQKELEGTKAPEQKPDEMSLTYSIIKEDRAHAGGRPRERIDIQSENAKTEREQIAVMMLAAVERHRETWPHVVLVFLKTDDPINPVLNGIRFAPDGCGLSGDDCTGEVWTGLLHGSVPSDLVA